MSAETLPFQEDQISAVQLAEQWLKLVTDIPSGAELPVVAGEEVVPRTMLDGVWIGMSARHVSRKALMILAEHSSFTSYCQADRAGNDDRPLHISLYP